MISRRCVARFALLSCLLGPVSACKQGEGDPCQTQADCEDGLRCVQQPGRDLKVCQSQVVDAAPIDARTLPDASRDAIDAAPGDVDAAPEAIDAAPDAIDAAPRDVDAAPDTIDAAPRDVDAA
jgi:hypothetical protein